tara:strand:- start:76 stop:1242 length:1167 start_codon:yes stop_codon:yes gene_type:complete
MEYLYIAESKSFSGLYKIGRTSRDVDERMQELSDNDYGPEGFSGDSDWEAVRVIEVEDSVSAEALVHSHFSQFRVDGERELFRLENPEQVAEEIAEITDGIVITADTFDLLNLATFNPVTLAMIASGLMITAETFFPENKHKYKAERFMRKWEKRLEDKAKKSKHPVAKGIFSFLNKSHKVSKKVGSFAGVLAMMPFWGKLQKSLDKSSITSRHAILSFNMGNKNDFYEHKSGILLTDNFSEKLDFAIKRFKPLNPNTKFTPFPGWLVHCKVCNFIHEKKDTFLKIKLLYENEGKLLSFIFDENGNFKYFDGAIFWIKENPEWIYEDAICDKCYLFEGKTKESFVDVYYMGVKIFDVNTNNKNEPIKFCLSDDEIYKNADKLGKRSPK